MAPLVDCQRIIDYLVVASFITPRACSASPVMNLMTLSYLDVAFQGSGIVLATEILVQLRYFHFQFASCCFSFVVNPVACLGLCGL